MPKMSNVSKYIDMDGNVAYRYGEDNVAEVALTACHGESSLGLLRGPLVFL